MKANATIDGIPGQGYAEIVQEYAGDVPTVKNVRGRFITSLEQAGPLARPSGETRTFRGRFSLPDDGPDRLGTIDVVVTETRHDGGLVHLRFKGSGPPRWEDGALEATPSE